MISILISFAILGISIFDILLEYNGDFMYNVRRIVKRWLILIPIIVGLLIWGNMRIKQKYTFMEYMDLKITSIPQSLYGRDSSTFIINMTKIKRPDYFIPGYHTIGIDSSGNLKRIYIDGRNFSMIKSDTEIPRIENYYVREIIRPYKSNIWFSNNEKIISEWRRSKSPPVIIVPTKTNIIETKNISKLNRTIEERRINKIINYIIK